MGGGFRTESDALLRRLWRRALVRAGETPEASVRKLRVSADDASVLLALLTELPA